jgi:hypothetical protein
MKLTITVDPAVSLAAGYEPTDTLDLDLAPLTPEQRADIAAIMDGSRVRAKLTSPTIEALLSAATASRIERETQAAQAAARKREKDEARERNTAALRERLQTKPTVERAGVTHVGYVSVPYRTVEPDISGIETWDIEDAELKAALRAWQDECGAETGRRQEAAQAEMRAQRDAEIAARAQMTPAEIIASLPEAVRSKVTRTYDRLVSDNGQTIVLSADGPVPSLMRYVKVDLPAGNPIFGLMTGDGEEYDTARYDVSDGVIAISGSHWAAVVADPAATKPKYDFLSRCPGGYTAPNVSVGDVIVWGSKDKKGRKQGPYDRLIYAIEDGKIRVIKTDYATARKLRKTLVS